MLKELSRAERANVFTHLPGVFFGIVAFCFSEIHGSNATLVYQASFLFMFIASSVYHWLPDGTKKANWRIADHISIFCLIAGTYTPFLIFVDSPKTSLVLIILWCCVLVGSILKVFFTGRFKVASTIIYLLMGWAAIFVMDEFLETLPRQILFWVAIGGLCYTVGTIFYLWKKWMLHHAIWHLFVLAAALAHWWAVYSLSQMR